MSRITNVIARSTDKEVEVNRSCISIDKEVEGDRMCIRCLGGHCHTASEVLLLGNFALLNVNKTHVQDQQINVVGRY